MNKYERAIIRFSCDFSLELEHCDKYSISKEIRKGNNELLYDIDVLMELDFMIRNGKARVKVYKNE